MKTKLSVRNILNGMILIGVIMIMGIFGIRALTSTKEINEEKSFFLENINEIQVSMLNETIHVIQTEARREVKFHLYGKSTTETKLISEIEDDKVIVRENRSKCGAFEGLFLDIYIPKDYNKDLSISITSGDVKMDTFNLSSFLLNSTSGKTEIKKNNYR